MFDQTVHNAADPVEGTGADKAITFNGCTVDFTRGTLTRGGEAVALRPKAMVVLKHLVKNPGRVVSKSELMDVAWPGVHVTEDSLTQSIREIRKALLDEDQKYLRTVSRRGYILAGASQPVAECCLRPSVGVTGIRNETGEVAAAPIASSIAEDIANGLTRFETFTVMLHLPADAVADYMVEGSLRRFGDEYFVSASLVETGSKQQLWGNRFAAPATGTLQDFEEIARRIAGLVAGHLDNIIARRAALKPIEHQAGHELVSRAFALLRTNEPTHFDAAIALIKEAAAREPCSGLVQAHLAFAMVMQSGYGWSRREDLDKALAAAQRAIELSPGLPMAHRVISFVQQYRREYDAAERHLQRAIDLNPCDADSIEQMGYLLTLRGRPLEALAWIDRARLLTPNPPEWYEQDRGFALYLIGEYRAGASAIELTPHPPVWMRAWLAACYAQMGDLETARRHTTSIPADDPGFSALDYANRNGSAFERASDNQHFAEGLYLALGLIEPKPLH